MRRMIRGRRLRRGCLVMGLLPVTEQGHACLLPYRIRLRFVCGIQQIAELRVLAIHYHRSVSIHPTPVELGRSEIIPDELGGCVLGSFDHDDNTQMCFGKSCLQMSSICPATPSFCRALRISLRILCLPYVGVYVLLAMFSACFDRFARS